MILDKIKKSVTIFNGPSWERWSFKSVDNEGCGGSETHAVQLAREFQKLGYKVQVFADIPEDEMNDNGIKWIHFLKFEEWSKYNFTDYFISERTTDPFKVNVRCSKAFVQIHDIWMLSPREQLFLDKVNKFCALSNWHMNFAAQHHSIPKEKMALTANGIDLSRFQDKNIERNPYRMIYSSSLDRGLDTLIYLFDFIKAEVPQLELHIYYGLDIWEKTAQARPEERQKIEYMKNLMKKKDVFFHGRVGQKQLAEEMLKSSLWAYPTDFEETFAITAIETQAAGLPVICSNYAGLQTTVNNSGIMIGNGTKGQSYTRDYRIEFVTKCIEVLKNKENWKLMSTLSLQNAQKFSWTNAALTWQKLFNE